MGYYYGFSKKCGKFNMAITCNCFILLKSADFHSSGQWGFILCIVPDFHLVISYWWKMAFTLHFPSVGVNKLLENEVLTSMCWFFNARVHTWMHTHTHTQFHSQYLHLLILWHEEIGKAGTWYGKYLQKWHLITYLLRVHHYARLVSRWNIYWAELITRKALLIDPYVYSEEQMR